MNEEEIIHCIELCIENNGIPSEGINWVKGLLDLYNKEKQENKKLKTLLYQIRNELKGNVIIKEDGIYKPCKNLTKQEVYKSYVKLNLMLKANYIFKNNEKAIEELLKEGE